MCYESLFVKYGIGAKFLKMGENTRAKILIWHMVGEMVKNRVGQGFIFHVIIPEFMHSCVNLNYGSTKQKPKM